MNTAILLISCPDRKGIVSRITNFIYQNNGNIEHADQHIDSETKTFFMRVEWALDGFKVLEGDIEKSFTPIATEFNMDWTLHLSRQVPRVAIFVSRFTHCLFDLLLRYKEGQFNCQIPVIVSNHPDAKEIAKDFNIKFVCFPKTKKNKQEVEKKEIELLNAEKIGLVVLARYTQILTSSFVESFPNRIINIHHSFLPAFVGKTPYKQAYACGVKIIGATSHYVTTELDAGPIIAQDIVRVSHRDSLQDLQIKGQDLERLVLTRAVRLCLGRKVLVYSNKTVIFD